MIICSCSTNQLVVTPEGSAGDKATNVAEEATEAIEDSIPTIYLTKCLWMIQLEDDSLEELHYVTKTNAERFRECYLIHNDLIDVLLERDNYVEEENTP